MRTIPGFRRSSPPRAFAALLLVPFLALSLAGCGGGIPLGVLDPVAVAEGTKQVPLFVATTRAKPKIELERMFSGDRDKTVNHAKLTVSIPPNHQTGQIEWPSRAPGDSRVNFVTADRDYMNSQAFLQTIKAELARRKPDDRTVLVFIHGYNTKFEEAVYRFAQIVNDSGFKGVPVLFTWPSRGALLDYPYDRESAVFSRDDLEATLDDIATKTGVRKIDVLAHSMGNFLFVETLRQATIRGNGTFHGKIGQIMLAAPDIDIDVFRRQLMVIGQLKLPITVFVSRDDKALNFSRMVWGSQVRAGAYTVSDPAVMEKLREANITVIDLSEVKGTDAMNHGKFASSPDVVKMIGGRLAEDGGIQQRPAGLGEGIMALGATVGHTVGQTVGTAVAAPGAILSGQAPVLAGQADSE
ncbi:alpha/beta hydrolase [Alsobacter sp. SYSU M60028]|uniref:Alpha/beta hydrolase n=1 Tax=Alsobacter ponti TaxID=2962936 RepID=A0ABT1LAN4_9HYPH|nr:alpha/beta hydrolase [Alsobacter ponti]MCP8937835.1 alpha/beta hydrolase [Alsobacter ponti]